MKFLHKLLLAAVPALMLASCAQDNPFGSSSDKGYIVPRLSTDTKVTGGGATRAQALTAPAISDCKIALTNKKGGIRQEWAADKFPSDEGFDVGDYLIEGYYGSADDEGFDKPYFYGSKEISVTAGNTTDASFYARLANSIVSLNITDAFKAYFKSFVITLQSAEGNPIILQDGDEGKNVFLKPGQVTLSIDFQIPGGKTTISPLRFTADPCHHYEVNLNVNNGQVNTAGFEDQLIISFTEELEKELVEINLSQELLEAAEPTATYSGPALPMDVLEKTPISGSPKITLFAEGGIRNVYLTLTSSNANYSLNLGDGNSVDLVGLDASKQQIFESRGLRAAGIFRNPDKMAMIDFSQLYNVLPNGSYTFKVEVADQLTRTASAEFKIDVTELGITIDSVEPVKLGDTEARFVVTSNVEGLSTDNFVVKIPGRTGLTPVTIKSMTAASARPTRDFPSHTYNVTVQLPENHNTDIQYRLYLHGSDSPAYTHPDVVEIQVPAYTLVEDAYCYTADFTISGANKELIKRFITLNASSVGTMALNGDNIHITGLAANQDYDKSKFTYSITNDKDGNAKLIGIPFHTEAAAVVPNGDFENLASQYYATIDQGGQYTRTLGGTKGGPNTQTFNVSEPNSGWATTNAKTYGAGSPANSWFKVFSVYNSTLQFTTNEATIGGLGGNKFVKPRSYHQSAQNGSNAMVIRNVGWNASGTVPDLYRNTAATPGKNYYNKYTPSSLNPSAGKLFLGTYSYSGGSETITEGVAFSSRPTSLSGYYKYATDSQDTGENGVITVKVLNADGAEIASGTKYLGAAGNYTRFDIPLTYSSNDKAAKLCIMITSSNRAESAIKVTKYAEYIQEAYGAVLCVDNLSFSYK